MTELASGREYTLWNRKEWLILWSRTVTVTVSVTGASSDELLHRKQAKSLVFGQAAEAAGLFREPAQEWSFEGDLVGPKRSH